MARRATSILLACALALSALSPAPLVLAPAVVSHPGGTVVEVVQGDVFKLSFRLRWDEDAKGYFVIAISWNSPRVDNGGTPSENFTFVGARAHFDNGEAIFAEARLAEGPAPENENVWTCSVVVSHTEGDPRNGEFNVDILLRAAGARGVFHSLTENHPISIVGSIDVAEDTFYSYTPPNPIVTIRVKQRNPTDDASVSSEWPHQNFGSEGGLKVYCTPGGEARAFLKFSLASLPSGASITSAKLYLYCYGMTLGMWPMEVHAVENDSWSEGAISWSNQPSYGALLDGYEGAAGEWWTWEVTSFVTEQFASDKVASFCLVASPEQEGYFNSKEAASNRPYLEVVYTLSESGASAGSLATVESEGVEISTSLTRAEAERIAISYVSEKLELPANVLLVGHAEVMRENRMLWFLKICDSMPLQSKVLDRPYGVVVNERGGAMDADEVLQRLREASKRRSKVEDELAKLLERTGPNDFIKVGIWVRDGGGVAPEQEIENVISRFKGKYPHLNFISDRIDPTSDVRPEIWDELEAEVSKVKRRATLSTLKPILDYITSKGRRVTYFSEWAPVIFAELNKQDISELEGMAEVDSIWLPKECLPAMASVGPTLKAKEVWAATFVVTRSELLGRILEIRGRWPYARGSERNALWTEISGIKSKWPFAPA